MAFDVWVELVCSECSKTTGGRHVYSQNIPRREIWADAKVLGWVKGGEGNMDVFCCQLCLDNYNKPLVAPGIALHGRPPGLV